MSPGPRRTAFAVFVAILGCLVLAALTGPAPALERDTGPAMSALELVSHPAAFGLPVAIAPLAIAAEARELVALDLSSNYSTPAPPFLIARYESASSGVGRPRALSSPSNYSLQAILDAHRPRRSPPLRC